jgi:hypothetical protein
MRLLYDASSSFVFVVDFQQLLWCLNIKECTESKVTDISEYLCSLERYSLKACFSSLEHAAPT